jgi:hypothetical protein
MFWYSIRYDEKAYAEAMAIVQKMNAAIAALNNISLGDFTLPDFTDINGGTVSTSSTNPEDELKRKQDEAYNIIRTAQEKITAIIKKQVEERKKALDDEYQAYEDEVNKKLKLLDEEEEKNDRRKTLDKEYKKKAELERLIEELKLDTSKEAEIRRKELQAQLDEENSTIADILAKNNKEDQKKNLEDQLEEQRKRIEEQKKLLDEQYSDANIEQMVKNALMSGYLTDLNGKMISLKDAFIEYENIYGEGLGALGDKIKTDLIDNLTKALELMKQLGENGTFNFSVKGSDSVQGSHASGGLVNYTGLGMLHGTSSTPEIVLNNAQATNLFNFIKNPIKPIDLRKYLPALPLPILPKTQLAGAGNMSFDIKNSISVEGNLDKTIVPDLVEKISNYTIEKINNSILFRRR